MTLKGQNALRDVDRASFGARHENLKEDRRILSAAKMLRTLLRRQRQKSTQGLCVACVALRRVETTLCREADAIE